MRGGILLLVPQISSAREHFAAAYDHSAEIIGIIALCRLLEREAHEFLVVSGRRVFDSSRKRQSGDRQCQCAERQRRDMAPAQSDCVPSMLSHCLGLSPLRKVSMACTSWRGQAVPVGELNKDFKRRRAAGRTQNCDRRRVAW
jgi:hypothetical protein